MVYCKKGIKYTLVEYPSLLVHSEAFSLSLRGDQTLRADYHQIWIQILTQIVIKFSLVTSEHLKLHDLDYHLDMDLVQCLHHLVTCKSLE